MNDDDRLLRALAHLSAEEKEKEMTRLDGRWDVLSRGELDDEGEAELRALADESEEMRAAWEAFRPVDPEFRRQLTQRLRDRARSRAARRWWPLAVAACLLAALSGWLLPQIGRNADQRALPPYSVESRGGLATQRSSAAAEDIPRLIGRLKLELTLVPAATVQGPVALAGFVEQNGTLHPWQAAGERAQVASTGAIRLEVRAPDLRPGLEAGSVTLWLAVARPDRLPGIEELPKLIAGHGDQQVRLLSQHLLLLEDAPPGPPGQGPP